MEEMEKWNYLINKKVKLIYEDGNSHFSKKEGIILEVTQTHILLKTSYSTEAVNLTKILRVEELKDG
jgi:hypothetical protein